MQEGSRANTLFPARASLRWNRDQQDITAIRRRARRRMKVLCTNIRTSLVGHGQPAFQCSTCPAKAGRSRHVRSWTQA